MSTQIYKNTPDISPGHLLKRKVSGFLILDLLELVVLDGRRGGFLLVAVMKLGDIDLDALSPVPVLVVPLPGLQRPLNDHHPALAQILADRLRRSAPCDAVYECGVILLAVDREGK